MATRTPTRPAAGSTTRTARPAKAPAAKRSATSPPRAVAGRLSALDDARQNTKAVLDVVQATLGARSAQEAATVALSAVRSAFNWAYGSYWALDESTGTLRFSLESGVVNEEFRRASAEASFREGVGLSGRAWRARDLYMVEDLGQMTDCPRAPAARRAGVRSGVCFPVSVAGEVVGTMDFFALEEITLSSERLETLRSVGRLVSASMERLRDLERQRDAMQDAAAVGRVLTAVTGGRDLDGIARIALEVVREAFGWAYGSYWALDEERQELRFAVESGTVSDDFRRASVAASFREGVGLSGRAWRARDLFVVDDLGQMTDCPRAAVAQRAGVRSGICFPLVIKGRVIGTMDFFALERLQLSPSRMEALRTVATAVSNSAERVQLAVEFERDVQAVVQVVGTSATELQAGATNMAIAAEQVTRQANMVAAASAEATRNVQTVAGSAQQLTSSIREIADQALEASSVVREAVQQATDASGLMTKLGESSQEIGQVIKVITSIAQQTNLLALNATIEAARAGEAGRGFVVVANEVKELARQTARATDEISARIGGVQTDTRDAVSAIQRVSSIIARVNDISASIAGAVEEQNLATSEISRSVSEAARGTAEVSENIAVVTTGSVESGRTAEAMRQSSGKLSVEADRLQQAVGSFLGRIRGG